MLLPELLKMYFNPGYLPGENALGVLVGSLLIAATAGRFIYLLARRSARG